MKTLQEKIAVMKAHDEGKKIEYKFYVGNGNQWTGTDNPRWNWGDFDYRVGPEAPKEIWVNEYGTPCATWFVYSDKKRAEAGAASTATRVAVRYREVVE